MDLENQKRVKDFAEKYGAENVVVILGVQLGLTVYHICEDEIKAEVDAGVYEDEISMMEMVMDVDDIASEMSSIRDEFCKYL